MSSKRKIALLIITLLFVFGFINQKQADQLAKLADMYSNEIIVNQVFDGDTIQVKTRGETETIRLIGVDTPETHHPDKPAQCYGKEASQFLNDFIDDKTINLKSDVISDNTDAYDRLLRYVYYDDKDINYMLIRRGYGFALRAFDHSKIDAYIHAEELAQEDKLGIWSNCEIEGNKYLQTNPI